MVGAGGEGGPKGAVARLAGGGLRGVAVCLCPGMSVCRSVGLGSCECVAKFRPLTFLFRHALLIRNVVRISPI